MSNISGVYVGAFFHPLVCSSDLAVRMAVGQSDDIQVSTESSSIFTLVVTLVHRRWSHWLLGVKGLEIESLSSM
jgi:hypothetical protein